MIQNENDIRCEAESTSPILTCASVTFRSVEERISLAKKVLLLAPARGLFHGQHFPSRYHAQALQWKDDLMNKMRATPAYFMCLVQPACRTFGQVPCSHALENEKQDDGNFGNWALGKRENADPL